MSHDGKWVVRLDQRQNEAGIHADLQLIDQFWQRSMAERGQSQGDAIVASPSARQLPTARFVLLTNPAGEPVGMTGVILPHPSVRFLFESKTGWPLANLPSADRGQYCEGLGLYIVPEYRRCGWGYLLTVLAILWGWHHGVRYVLAENGGVSLQMALSAGFAHTGLQTKQRGDVPYFLMVGDACRVLASSLPAIQSGLVRCSCCPLLQMAITAWPTTSFTVTSA
ncbi:hypothetical protein [Chitinivorax sp. B]|uniref:hypothetical protein n=1 Tax=Chitinivorax sp. B TaxID=2502235 RepID=UPI0010F80F54|nr:hypothetical protein [Chitinivorax sp. B]